MRSILPVRASLDSRLPQAMHLPLALHLPVLALVLAAVAWLGCTLLARRLGRDSLLRSLLLRARLSLAIPLLLGGVLLWLLRLLPPLEFPWPSVQELRRLLVVLALAWSLARCRGALLLAVERTAAVAALVQGQATSSLAVGEALLTGRAAEAIARLDSLLQAGEPALRIVASLTSQIRGWLWVALLERQGESDVGVIAKAAGIGNPRRVYVLRKQIRGRQAGQLLDLLRRVLEVETSLKRGGDPAAVFRDGFLLATDSRDQGGSGLDNRDRAA